MRKSVLRILTGAAGLGLVTTALTGVGQAQAAPVVQLTCNSIPTFQIQCSILYGNTLGPVTIKWFANQHIPAFDNKTFISFGCFGGSVPVTVQVTDKSGTSESEVPECITQG